jgi:hypothetical protein
MTPSEFRAGEIKTAMTGCSTEPEAIENPYLFDIRYSG